MIAVSLLAGSDRARLRTALGLTQSQAFHCDATICYGIGTTHVVFQRLQQLINALEGIFGLPLVTDGFIGPQTVQSLQVAATLVASTTNAPSIIQTASTEITKEWIAQNAAELVAALESAVMKLGLAIPPLTSTQPSIPTPGSAIGPGASPISAATSRGWWIVGGVAAILLVGGIGYEIVHRRGGVG